MPSTRFIRSIWRGGKFRHATYSSGIPAASPTKGSPALSPAGLRAPCPAPKLSIISAATSGRPCLPWPRASASGLTACIKSRESKVSPRTSSRRRTNPRFRRPSWYPVQPMGGLEALRRYPDHDMLGICLPPNLSLQQVYEAAPQATSRQLFVAGYFSRSAFGGGRQGIMSEMQGLNFRRVDCIARWGLEAPDRQTLIHVWHT